MTVAQLVVVMVDPAGPTSRYFLLSGASAGWLHFLTIIIGVTLPILLVATGIGVLWALWPGTTGHDHGRASQSPLEGSSTP